MRNRSFEKFGNRMLPGGDLYKQEKAFFDMVRAREESYVEEWLQTLHCPIIRVDGTKSIEENIVSIMKQIQNKSQETGPAIYLRVTRPVS